MSSWPRWSLEGEPLALARYVLPDQVARHARLPGRSGESRLARLRAVYQALAQLKIGYAYEAPTDETGRHVIRSPDQVLWAPRHATCLDLALILTGGCLIAGLHPAVVILAPPDGGGSLHALLLVRLDHDLTPTPATEAVWSTPPAWLLPNLQHQANGLPGKVVAVDPVGMAESLGVTPTRGIKVSFEDAVTSGARYLTGTNNTAGWVWKVGVDIGATWRAQDVEPLDAHPAAEPLRKPYRKPDTAESPLRLLRAEYQLVEFQNRDELTVLRDFCHRTAAGDRTGLAVISGIGGCGKTRLALEVAERLRAEGWYAGTLPKVPKAMAGVDWLAEVVSPVLVVLDYADGRATDATTLLAALRNRRGPPAVVLLTARTLDGDWLATIIESLDSDAHPYRRKDITLPDTHPHPGDVYHRTVTALTPAAVQPPMLPRGIRWTTLDYVLLGWIAAQGTPTLPATRDKLYDQVLEHEQNYWCTVYRNTVHDRKPRRARLCKAAACLSLVAAPEQRADAVLAAVADLRNNSQELYDVRDILITCLRPAPGEGLALRPDPIGDHLLLREFAYDEGLLLRTLDAGGDQELGQSLVTLVRAGQNDPDTASRLITSLLDADIARWPSVLAIASAQGGAAASSLEQLASRAQTPLPLDELSAVLPFSPLGLYQLALIVDQRLLDTARANGADQVTIAELLLRVSTRASDAGDRAGALASITEVVAHYRQLAATNPAAYLPNLATSLNNLSNRLADTNQASAIPATRHAAIDAMAHPAARAELRAAWVRWLSAAEPPQHAWEALHHAAADADLPPPDQQPPDRTSIILTMRARQAVRALAQDLGPPATDRLPIWASAPLPDTHLDLINAYAQANDWPTAQAVLNDHREILTSPQFPTTLTALAGLHLTNPIPGQLLRLLAEIDESGIDTTFAQHHANHQRRALLTAWINTPTWLESRDYYHQHHTDLTTADTRAVLASTDDDTARQHLAILDLTGVMPAEQVYAIVTDPATAEDAALDAIEHADLTRLVAIATAAPHALQARPSTWGLLHAVFLIAADQPDSAYDIAHQLAEQASPLQRRAHAIRLRALRTHHPDLPGLNELIDILNPDNAAT
ncbi:MAG: hypothetical protein JO272_18395 [Pseudonocardiales bacterium]|nr:hypothetical protein [Pseudonocardiales bacterium]